MKRYKVVGWYVDDPYDEASSAYALVVYVNARNRAMAFDDGEGQLRKIAAKPENLLNWYVQEATPAQVRSIEEIDSANIGGDDDADAQQ